MGLYTFEDFWDCDTAWYLIKKQLRWHCKSRNLWAAEFFYNESLMIIQAQLMINDWT